MESKIHLVIVFVFCDILLSSGLLPPWQENPYIFIE